MKWFDPISERWFDPPASGGGDPPLSQDDQQKIQRLELEAAARKADADRVWNALVASATSSHVSGSKPAEEWQPGPNVVIIHEDAGGEVWGGD